MINTAIILSVTGLFRTAIVLVIAWLIISPVVQLLVRSSTSARDRGAEQPESKQEESILFETKKKTKQVDKNQGEYVDFEEIK